MPDNLQHPKILALPKLLEQLRPLRQAQQRLVFTNGCFDLLHPGHADLLARAKAHGDILVVGLNTDASIQRLGKGSDRPITPLASRAFVLAHLAAVDFVTSFATDTPLELISALCPDVLIKGGDWQPEQIVGRDIVVAHGGQVLSLPLLPGFSTTSIIQRIRSTSPSS